MIAEQLDGKRIAITGSTGFVGTALVERLLRDVPDCELVLLVRRAGLRRQPAVIVDLAAARGVKLRVVRIHAARFRRGLVIHRLLQTLADIARERRLEAGRRFLALPAHGLDATTREAWTDPSLSADFPDLLAWRDALYSAHRAA